MSRPGRIGLCTDSSAHLPPVLVERYGVVVVPVTLTVDGHDRLDATPDAPGDVSEGARVEVARPSAGQYALAFEDLVADGASEILSLHGSVGEGAPSCSAARLAAHRLEVPVRLVDTRRGGFRLGACVWVAAEAVVAGASIDAAVAAAEACAAEVSTVVICSVLGGLAGHPGGRVRVLRSDADDPELAAELVGEFDHVLDAVNAVARLVLDHGDDLRVGIGCADARIAPVADALASALGESAAVREVVHHRLTGWADDVAADALTCTVVPGRVFDPATTGAAP